MSQHDARTHEHDAYTARTMVRRYGAPAAARVAQQQADISDDAGFSELRVRWLQVKDEIARLGRASQ